MNDENYIKEKKKNRDRVSYLLFLLLLTAIFLTTSTYAWFSTNRILTIDTIHIKVQSEGSLDISVDGVNFKAGVTEQDLIEAHDKNYPSSINQLPAYIEPVSTIGNLDNNGLMEMFFGNIDSNSNGDYIIVSERSLETESKGEKSDGKFLAFDLFLRTSTTKDLYITNKSKVTYNGEYSTGIENAIRIALIIEGTTTADSDINTIQNLKTNDSNSVYIWEPNYNSHIATGISHAKDVYGLIISYNMENNIPYDGIKASFEKTNNITFSRANSTNYPNLFSTVVPKILTTTNNDKYQKIFQLQKGITKMRVYIWIEGQDVDCENGASVGDLVATLQFSTNPS